MESMKAIVLLALGAGLSLAQETPTEREAASGGNARLPEQIGDGLAKQVAVLGRVDIFDNAE